MQLLLDHYLQTKVELISGITSFQKLDREWACKWACNRYRSRLSEQTLSTVEQLLHSKIMKGQMDAACWSPQCTNNFSVSAISSSPYTSGFKTRTEDRGGLSTPLWKQATHFPTIFPGGQFLQAQNKTYFS